MASTIPGPAREFLKPSPTPWTRRSVANDAAAYDRRDRPAGPRSRSAAVCSATCCGRRWRTPNPNGLNSDDITLVIGRCYRGRLRPGCRPERVDVTVLGQHARQSPYPAGASVLLPLRPEASAADLRPVQTRTAPKAHQPGLGAQPQTRSTNKTASACALPRPQSAPASHDPGPAHRPTPATPHPPGNRRSITRDERSPLQ